MDKNNKDIRTMIRNRVLKEHPFKKFINQVETQMKEHSLEIVEGKEDTLKNEMFEHYMQWVDKKIDLIEMNLRGKEK